MEDTFNRTFVIENQLGLHARPAAQLVQTTHKYPNVDVRITKNGETVDGKSIMGVLMLCAELGSSINVIAKGDGAEQLLNELEQLIKNKFGEE